MEKTNILFVCTGNVFRSMTAKYCLEKYLQDRKMNDLEADSAGIDTNPNSLDVPLFISNYLASLGIDVSGHKQKRVEEKHLRRADLIVAMGENHRVFIKENFGYSSRLFNEICYEKQTGIPDVCEKIPNWKENMHLSIPYAEQVIQYIYDSTPFFKKIYVK